MDRSARVSLAACRETFPINISISTQSLSCILGNFYKYLIVSSGRNFSTLLNIYTQYYIFYRRIWQHAEPLVDFFEQVIIQLDSKVSSLESSKNVNQSFQFKFGPALCQPKISPKGAPGLYFAVICGSPPVFVWVRVSFPSKDDE